MAQSIDQAFITLFDREVHLAFQRMGSKLMNTVRRRNSVNGSTVTFQKIAKGAATTKARHAAVVQMNLDHTNVSATLEDYYASDFIDKLDLLKTNIDERQSVANSAAWACGRRADQNITDAMSSATNSIAHGNAGLTRPKIDEVFIAFGNNDVPDDGARYLGVSPKSWTDLLSIDEFSNLDYVGADALPYKNGMTAKRWMSFIIFPYSGFELAASVRDQYAWHRSSVGLGVGQDVTTEVNYVPEKVSHLYTSMVSLGSVIIDNDGLYEIKTYEA